MEARYQVDLDEIDRENNNIRKQWLLVNLLTKVRNDKKTGKPHEKLKYKEFIKKLEIQEQHIILDTKLYKYEFTQDITESFNAINDIFKSRHSAKSCNSFVCFFYKEFMINVSNLDTNRKITIEEYNKNPNIFGMPNFTEDGMVEEIHMTDFLTTNIIDKTNKTIRPCGKDENFILRFISEARYMSCFIRHYAKLIINNYPPEVIPEIFAENFIKNNILCEKDIESIKIILLYGLYENYLVTTYMVPAIIEKMFRNILFQANKSIVKTKNDNFQENYKLGEMLQPGDLRDQLDKYFEKNNDIHILENIYTLLIKCDFRNDVYHGRREEAELQSLGCYLWYIFSSMIFIQSMKNR